ncbi:MAG: AraC family transcriptional regulator [Kordiimonadaceae bacterium]|nr:AraC family transcriptional regulator [Kordiimonadaceae bacterium]MBT6036003.1 AraC family transcriptional regulator [Kordiimonadaceae bacterium]MBT6328573.1 AraC family transcriptional regulator [Kordiimonadaceae bacterium]MBT7581847.1 AraC family transcriptional regulator [Kordiimonadaceae bacterium]
MLLFVKDTQSTLMNCNQQFAEHFGFDNVDIIKGKTDFDLFNHELAVQYRKDDAEVFVTSKSKLNIIELFPNHMGEEQWFICNKVPIIDAGGKVQGLCGALQELEDSSVNLRPFNDISKALNYLKDNYTKKICNEDMAKVAGLSVRQFEKRFKRIFNTSAHQYILNLRILKSCDLLIAGGLSISETAHRLGFYDQSAFTSHFKKHLGITPMNYIKQHSINRHASE